MELKKLNWKDTDDSIPLEYPPHIWRYVENAFEQFVAGDHSMTKAYQDYLSLTDDYDYCWGPINEGEPGEERLWGTYVRNSGEVYLLQANADCTGWEKDEFLIFAPSGSRRAAICFNSSGKYEIGLEVIPPQSDPEIWLMSPPYYDNATRKICSGVSPKVICYQEEVLLFYQPVADRRKIVFRKSSENYSIEHSVDLIFSANSVELLKVIQHSTEDRDSLALFYYQNGDIEPVKYITSSPVLKERCSPDIELAGIQWMEIIITTKEMIDNIQPDMGIVVVEWELLSMNYEKNIDENIEFCAELNAINWQVCNTLSSEFDENTEISAGVQNILWIVMWR